MTRSPWLHSGEFFASMYLLTEFTEFL
jgi:hypothetical protein